MKTQTQEKHNEASPQQIGRDFFLQFEPPKSSPLLGFSFVYVPFSTSMMLEHLQLRSHLMSSAYWILLAVIYVCLCVFFSESFLHDLGRGRKNERRNSEREIELA